MSEQNRTVEEYLERYAEMYCSEDIEEAKKHAIVRVVMKEKESEHGWRNTIQGKEKR